jgi:hypothetical protein
MYAVVFALFISAAAALHCTPEPRGCFNDAAGPRAVPTLALAGGSVTAALCTDACASSGFEYSGVTSHTTPLPAEALCYCGAAPDAAAVPAAAADCAGPCPTGGALPSYAAALSPLRRVRLL